MKSAYGKIIVKEYKVPQAAKTQAVNGLAVITQKVNLAKLEVAIEGHTSETGTLMPGDFVYVPESSLVGNSVPRYTINETPVMVLPSHLVITMEKA